MLFLLFQQSYIGLVSARIFGWMGASGRLCLRTVSHAVSHTHAGPAPLRTSPTSRREGGSGGCPIGVGRRRRHRGEAAKGEERDAIPDLFLKHSDAAFETYVRRHMKHLKHVSETLVKTLENHYKTYATSI